MFASIPALPASLQCLAGHSMRLALPSWASFRVYDPATPLRTQVKAAADTLVFAPTCCLCAALLMCVFEQISTADVIIPTTANVGEAEIAAARKAKLVVQPAAGYNNIDVAECAARGIPVCTCPGKHP